jgi:probable HAF family extracellular repeat protein
MLFLILSAIALTTSAALAATFTTIDVPRVTLTQARGINNGGQIVGFYEDNGIFHGFLLDDGSVKGSFR